MREERYGFRVRQALNHGLKDIPPAASRRLEARHLHSHTRSRRRHRRRWRIGQRILPNGAQTPYLKQILAVVALLLGMWISFYWHSVQYVTEIEEVDSALLTDDLPPTLS